MQAGRDHAEGSSRAGMAFAALRPAKALRRCVIAALGTRCWSCARDRPMAPILDNVTPEHTELARKAARPGKLLSGAGGHPRYRCAGARPRPNLPRHYTELPILQQWKRIGFPTPISRRRLSDRIIERCRLGGREGPERAALRPMEGRADPRLHSGWGAGTGRTAGPGQAA